MYRPKRGSTGVMILYTFWLMFLKWFFRRRVRKMRAEEERPNW